jgi:hypothetical protein
VYDNVRYTPAIVNRTGIADMDIIDTLATVLEPPAKAPKSKKPKAAKPKAKPKPKKKAKRPAKPKTKKPAKTKKKAKVAVVARSERLDMRLTKAEKAKIYAKAKKTRRTVTSLVIEAIEKIK